jgi:enoyl-CoA hydratase/carnithine racemase
VEATKRTAHRALDLSPEESGRIWAEELRALRRSNDHKAAIAAFRERREPIFTRS